ncbi:MAG: rRNA maturation RNase YbeY [Candidatus Omnitrophota bacterium]
MKATKKHTVATGCPEVFFGKTKGILIHISAKGLRQGLPFSSKSARNFIEKILKKENICLAHLTIVLASNAFVRTLNKKFLSKDEYTDCLAFDLKPKAWPRDCLFGDVVISVDAARIASKQNLLPFKEELSRYIIHGILHLTGFDDTTSLSRKKMWKRQEELVFGLLKYLK